MRAIWYDVWPQEIIIHTKRSYCSEKGKYILKRNTLAKVEKETEVECQKGNEDYNSDESNEFVITYIIM